MLDQLNALISTNIGPVVVGLVVVVLALVLAVLGLIRRARKLNRRLDSLTRGGDGQSLEAEATAKEKAAIAESLRQRNRNASPHDIRGTADINAPLAVRAAHEYAYVSRDVKRIAITGGLMVGILAVLHVLVNVMGVITL